MNTAIQTSFPIENATFEKVAQNYEKKWFLVIKWKEVLWVYPTREEWALAWNTKWGYEEDFLVKWLNPEDNIIHFVRYVP